MLRRILFLVCLLTLLTSSATAQTAVTRYVNTDCASNGDGTALTCAAGAGQPGAHNSLFNAEAANRDLVANDELWLIQVSGEAPDTTCVVIDGWTTDATHTLTIGPADGQEHGGRWPKKTYRLAADCATQTLSIADDYVTVDGLAIDNLDIDGGVQNVVEFDGGDNSVVRNSYIKKSFGENLLTYSEQLDNAAWTTGASGASVTSDVRDSFLNTATADKVVEDGSSGQHYIVQSATLTQDVPYVFSVDVHTSSERNAYIVINDTGVLTVNAVISSSTGAILSTTETTGTFDDIYVRSLGDGWYRVFMHVTPGVGIGATDFYLQTASGTTVSYAGDAASGTVYFGAQLSTKNDNLFDFEEGFDDAAWTKTRATVSADATLSPFGMPTAEILVEDATAGASHYVAQSITLTDSTQYQFGLYAKKRARDHVQFEIFDSGIVFLEIYADLSDCTVAQIGEFSGSSFDNYFVRTAPNGWCYLGGYFTTPGAGSGVTDVNIFITDGTTESYNGDAASDIAIWNAHIFPVSASLGKGDSYVATTSAARSFSAGTSNYCVNLDGANNANFYAAFYNNLVSNCVTSVYAETGTDTDFDIFYNTVVFPRVYGIYVNRADDAASVTRVFNNLLYQAADTDYETALTTSTIVTAANNTSDASSDDGGARQDQRAYAFVAGSYDLLSTDTIAIDRAEIQGGIVDHDYQGDPRDFSQNLFVRSDDLATAWTSTRVTVATDTTLDPFGTTLADTVTEGTDVNTTHVVSNTVAVLSNVEYQMGGYAKRTSLIAPKRDVSIRFDGAPFTASSYAHFDLSDCSTSGSSGGVTWLYAEAVDNDWCLIKARATTIAAGTGTFGYYLAETPGDVFYDGNGASQIYLTGLHLFSANAEDVYIPTAAAAITDGSFDVGWDEYTSLAGIPWWDAFVRRVCGGCF